jgi:1,4-dihydroxy-2-naphthoyl-CoA hydrolase
MIWKQTLELEGLNAIIDNALPSHLGITFTEFGDDFLRARMPIDRRTMQPAGILHGGASAALAETIGSVASLCCLEDITRHSVVGVELNISHLRPASAGAILATARPYRLGRTMHVWNIELRDEAERLISVARLTMAVISQR